MSMDDLGMGVVLDGAQEIVNLRAQNAELLAELKAACGPLGRAAQRNIDGARERFFAIKKAIAKAEDSQ